MNFGREHTRRKRKQIVSKKKKMQKKAASLLFQLLLLGLTALAVCIGSAGFGAYQGILASSPGIEDIDATPTGYLSTILDAKGNTTATLVASGSNRIYVTIDEIPKHLQNAFIAIEDSRFREHNGIDLKGIIRAGVKGVAAGFHFSEGASTITQQLLKNNVFTGWTAEKSQADRFKRKIQEQYLALQLEKVESKDWILENYLNTVNLGQNALGVQSASRTYFAKDVSELTLSESAVIAGITKNPSGYNPISHPKANAERREKVLSDMKKQELISQKQYDKAMADPVYTRIQAVNARQADKSSIHSYFDDAVTAQVIEDLMDKLGYSQTEAYKAIYNSGLTIYSTQDPKIQAICDEEVNNMENYPSNPKTSFSYTLTVQDKKGEFHYYDEQTMLSYYQSSNQDFSINFASRQEAEDAVERYKKDILKKGDTIPENGESLTFTIQPQAALTVIDPRSGKVKAIVGGRGEKTANRTLNRAMDSVRQPGSTFKVLAAFAPAIDTGQMTLASVEDDAPYTYENGTPLKNYDKIYSGFTNIREAITQSKNVVTVKVLDDIGIDTGFNYLTEHFGFTTLEEADHNEALALGGITRGVTNLELTAAYAALAQGGVYIKPRFYTKVLDHDGNVLLSNEPQKKRAVEKTTAWLLTNAMQDVLTVGTGTQAAFEGMPIAGKTGTTTKNKDTVFAGYTPYCACVVWGGFDDNTEQKKGEISYSKTIWRAVMSRIHQNRKYKEFKKPSGIVEAEVCKKSGMLVKDGICTDDPRGTMAYTEYFAKGTVPKEECEHHVRICPSSGLPMGPYCPYGSSVRIVGGSEDTDDSQYLYTGSVSDTCTVHTQAVPQAPQGVTGTQPEGGEGQQGTGGDPQDGEHPQEGTDTMIDEETDPSDDPENTGQQAGENEGAGAQPNTGAGESPGQEPGDGEAAGAGEDGAEGNGNPAAQDGAAESTSMPLESGGKAERNESAKEQGGGA